MHLDYLVDVFEHLNKLNLQLQGSGNNKLDDTANIFVFEDKLRAFISKIDLWIGKVEDELLIVSNIEKLGRRREIC